MKLLAIDTTGPRLQLGLLHGAAVDVLVEDMARGQAERIFPAIGELLARNGIAYPDLERIAVTTGPGSFTGLRIGLAAARGLGLSLELPVVGLPTLFAISLGEPLGPFAICLDARRGLYYMQEFHGPGAPRQEAVLTSDVRAPAERIIRDWQVPVEALARFAATADPAAFPPDPSYLRDADAKPQEKFRVARL